MSTLNTDDIVNKEHNGHLSENSDMKKRNGFTLVEVLIVVIILGVLAAAVVPAFTEASDDARAATSATMVKSLTRLCQTIKMKTGSYPNTIDDPTMFEGGSLPKNPFHPNPGSFCYVDSDVGQIHPEGIFVKPKGWSFWYNRTNGVVRTLVTQQNTEEETIALYNAANGCEYEKPTK